MVERQLEIRPYRDADHADVVALWERIFPDNREWNQPAAYIRRKRNVQPDLFLVGVLDGRLIATVLAGYDGVRGWIYHLAVAPTHRRHGVGSAMMRAAERRLHALGCPEDQSADLPDECGGGALLRTPRLRGRRPPQHGTTIRIARPPG